MTSKRRYNHTNDVVIALRVTKVVRNLPINASMPISSLLPVHKSSIWLTPVNSSQRVSRHVKSITWLPSLSDVNVSLVLMSRMAFAIAPEVVRPYGRVPVIGNRTPSWKVFASISIQNMFIKMVHHNTWGTSAILNILFRAHRRWPNSLFTCVLSIQSMPSINSIK